MNPIMIDFPTQFYTNQLLIRMPQPGDGPSYCEAVNASIAELKPWMKWAQKEHSEYESELHIRETHIQFLQREKLRFLIFLKDTGQFIGTSSLHAIDWDVRKFEIGYWIDSRCSGKGYMTEAVKGICDFAFNQLSARRLEIHCDTKNNKSRLIPERLGFELEGVMKNVDLSMDGSEWTDTCLFAKIK